MRPGSRTEPARQNVDSPMSFYEVHAGSWLRIVEEDFRSLTWTEMGERLVPYMVEMGFTHLEFLPIAEYPFGNSWGYQPLGLFSPTGRYGRAEEFAALVDRCHSAGIGVIVDWVPAHFPTDVWGLARFDGTALYEHPDPREGFQRDWNTYLYNLSLNQVKGFLIASALEWIEHYHVDGLRVDAVSSMLYRDYSREPGEWIPNRYGGRENLEVNRVLQAPQQHHRAKESRRPDDCGGVDGLAKGHRDTCGRRSRFLAQVEHGLDARHAPLHVEGSDLPLI